MTVKNKLPKKEHANEYPTYWIDTMKQIGIFGLAVPEEYGGSPVSMPCYAQVTEELARGWMSLAGAMGGHTVRLRITEQMIQRAKPAKVRKRRRTK